jgi:3-phosphoglycerate kinase
MNSNIIFVDQVNLQNLRILMRVDFNVSLNPQGEISDDTKIRQTLPTINYLLQKNNKLILVSHLGKPKTRDRRFSLRVVATRLKELLPNNQIVLVDDFLTADPQVFSAQTPQKIILLENIRYYPQEKENNLDFAQKLANLAQVFVNDGFGVSHRKAASVVGVTQFLPSYGGLLLKSELENIQKIIFSSQSPKVIIIGGAKISSKIGVIKKFLTLADYLLIGGAMANNFLKAQGFIVGRSLIEPDFIDTAKQFLALALEQNRKIILPQDARVMNNTNLPTAAIIKKITEVNLDDNILDIGPETEKIYTDIINQAKTIVWNGPLGYFENPYFSQGTKTIYQSIITNQNALSIIGGGDTLTAIKNYPDQNKITHISTGGGAMLELIEKGTLPGLEALATKHNLV